MRHWFEAGRAFDTVPSRRSSWTQLLHRCEPYRGQPRPDLDREQPNGRGASVRITTRDGATAERRVDWPKGHSAGDGITWEDLSGKWMEALPDVDVARVIALSRRLEQLDDVSQLLRAFDP